MRILCAYCERDGKPALIAEQEPREDQRTSHGICQEHRRQLEAEIASVKSTTKINEDH